MLVTETLAWFCVLSRLFLGLFLELFLGLFQFVKADSHFGRNSKGIDEIYQCNCGGYRRRLFEYRGFIAIDRRAVDNGEWGEWALVCSSER